MKATFRFHQLQLPRKRFEIATGAKTVADVFIVEAETDGVRGIGAGSPARSMNDTPLGCRNTLIKECSQSLDPQDYFDDRIAFSIREESPSAAAAIDIAIWDLFAKQYGVSLCSIMGVAGSEIETGATIDIKPPQFAAEEAKRILGEGFKRVKIKVGTSVNDDVERVKIIRDSVGQETKLFADANGGYAVAKAVSFWERAEKYELDFFEQPVPGDKLNDMSMLRKKHRIPVCADESVSDERTLEKAIKAEALDILNIKLMKCGGLSPAIQMIKVAQDAGIEVMMGCMSDIGISIAAAAHLSISKGIRLADLDSHLNIEPICDGPEVKNGILRLSTESGLGINLINGWHKWATL